MRRIAVLAVSIVLAGSAPAFAVPHDDAEQAYAAGDFKTAFALWLPLAEQGSARAQANIARMYERGEWVAQDPAMAAEWYQRAAQNGQRDMSQSSSQSTAQTIVLPVTTAQTVPAPVYTPPPPRPVYYPPTYPTVSPPTYLRPPVFLVPVHRHWRH